jgi:hypothetical protein
MAPRIHDQEKKNQEAQPKQDDQAGFVFPEFLETPYKLLHGPETYTLGQEKPKVLINRGRHRSKMRSALTCGCAAETRGEIQ